MIDILQQALAERDAALTLLGGCSDGGCCIIRPRGQHTNGGCRCISYPENKYRAEHALRINQRFAEIVRTAITKES